jgi:hypothetical protein
MLHGGVADFARAGLRVAPRVCIVTRPERLPDLMGLPGARVTRRERLGGSVALVELARAEGSPEARALDPDARVAEIDTRAAYARFGADAVRSR